MTSNKNSKYVEVEKAEPETTSIIKSNIQKEISKLKEYDILENFEIETEDKLLTKMTDVAYQNDNKYVLNNIYIKIEDKEYLFIVEEKTGKILCIGVQNGSISDIELEELMRNYIKYLDLYIIDDWEFQDNKLKSEKAKLEVYFIKSENDCALTIHSTDRIYVQE